MKNNLRKDLKVATRFDFDATEDEWNNFLIDMNEIFDKSKPECVLPEINSFGSLITGEPTIITLTPECYNH